MDYNELDGNIGEENFAEEMPDNGAGAMEHHHDKNGRKGFGQGLIHDGNPPFGRMQVDVVPL